MTNPVVEIQRTHRVAKREWRNPDDFDDLGLRREPPVSQKTLHHSCRSRRRTNASSDKMATDPMP